MRSKIAGDYGIDAPYVPILSAIGGFALLVYAVFLTGSSRWITAAFGVLLLCQVVSYMYVTRSGKFALWREIVDGLSLQSNARVLDIGCGRGMVVITALASQSGVQGVGVDLWRSRDQSGNDPATTTANAFANGVSDRLELLTEDMTKLSVPSDSFDAVLANVAIQNVKDRQLRRDTIGEIYRATAPGGQIRIVDIQYVKEYAADLKELGAANVSVTNLGPRGWFGNPFFASRLVSASKPA